MFVGYARVSLPDQQLTLQKDALQRAGIIEIIGGHFARDAPTPAGIEVSVQNPIVRFLTEMLFLVEKMQSLIAEQGNVRMLRQEIVDRGRPGLLHPSDDEIHPVNLASAEKIRSCWRFFDPVARFHLQNSYHFLEVKLDRHLASRENSGFYRKRG